MTPDTSDMLILAGAVSADALGETLGKLALDKPDATEPAGFELLDSFDQAVRKSGAVLIDSGGTLHLMQPGGVVKSQAAKRRGNYVADLADGPVKDALSFVSDLRTLQVVGRGTLQQSFAAAKDDEEKTHARVRFSTLAPAGGGEEITLVSLQPLRGYEKSFEALGSRVQTVADGPELKARDLYARLFPETHDFDPKPTVAMSGDETAFQAAIDIIRAFLDVARRTEAGVIADYDTEYLHDYRVALRKIRSVISLFKGVFSDEETARLKETFSDLMAPTGRLRDLDVYLLERDTYFDLVPPAMHDGLTAMFDMFAKERNAAQRAIARRLGSADYAKQMQKLQAQFADPKKLKRGPQADRPAHDYACALIWKRYRKVCKIARSIDDQTPDEEVHELRISCKKLRYLMEFFAPLFPAKDIKGLIKPLKVLQDNLGLFNDYSVQQESLQDFLDQKAGRGRKQDLVIARSIGALIAVLHQRQLKERSRVVASFAQFDSAETQDAFRALFKET
ncbi:CHAD domain-containing protein [Chachezhania antarctica]|uniref:CHAD domain-containing protein n=1 Tax=Chachezhania antarctica TaxID=2340860 RepID=UPI001F091B7E|nr:CHAD domain-containing protein [Chachezhania antarctica]|tara:strand:+ start:2339 stop:3862 length:1524 start_codon:yes stop_codon:yes gene_type:complete